MNEEEAADSQFTESELFRLNIIFKHIQHDTNGKIRVKHVFDICSQLGIKYAKSKLPPSVLMNQTECLLTSMAECKRLINVIRVVGTLVFVTCFFNSITVIFILLW